MNKYGEVYSYVIHKSDNVRPILEALFEAGFIWTGSGQDLKHFDSHLVISEMTDGSRYVSISEDFDRCVNHNKRTPLNKFQFMEWFNSMSFGCECDIVESTYQIDRKVLIEAMQCVPTNAIHPIVVTWKGLKYHFTDKQEVYEYFERTMGYEIK